MLDDHFLKINDSFLSKRKCNSLIKYFKRNKSDHDRYKPHGTQMIHLYNQSYPLRLFYKHWKLRSLVKRIDKVVKTQLPHLRATKLDSAQIVRWPVGSATDVHQDQNTGYGKRGWIDSCSALVYLNEDFTGGETELYLKDVNNYEITRVLPSTGRIILFSNGLTYHRVSPITKGDRYTLTTYFV